jgi:hypothetical protein
MVIFSSWTISSRLPSKSKMLLQGKHPALEIVEFLLGLDSNVDFRHNVTLSFQYVIPCNLASEKPVPRNCNRSS